MTETGAIGIQRDEAVATVRVGTGHRANALGTRDWQALATLFEDLAEDRSLGVVVLTGRGNRTFSAGSDMREWLSADPAEIDASFAAMESALTAIERLPVPVIAQIRGAAVGAGCQLACACDLRLISSDATMGMPIARWGSWYRPPSRPVSPCSPARRRPVTCSDRTADGRCGRRYGSGWPPPASPRTPWTPPRPT